jgi:hypothetical protein
MSLTTACVRFLNYLPPVVARDDIPDSQVKMVCIASLNDQVVPLYSGLFTAASHPLILRALYIDGDVYQLRSSLFLRNDLVWCLRSLTPPHAHFQLI